MQRSTRLFFAVSWVAWGFATGCEAEESANRIGTAQFAPGPDGSAGGASGSAAQDSGTDDDADCIGAGCSGDAGQTGAGGDMGSAGRAGSGSAGTNAAGGSSGASGEQQLCAEACNRDADCGSSMPNQVFRCNIGAQRCEGFAAPCRNEAECIPGASQWLWSCSSDQECFFFDDDVCVTVAGVGRCARSAPAPAASGGGCVYPVPNAISLPRQGAAGTVLVCADNSQKCHEGKCILACKADQECTPDKNGSSCNEQTGLCECVADIDCRGPGVSHCNTTTHQCECADDDDCDGVQNTDKCIAGRCGCSSASACKAERVFSGTRYVCE